MVRFVGANDVLPWLVWNVGYHSLLTHLRHHHCGMAAFEHYSHRWRAGKTKQSFNSISTRTSNVPRAFAMSSKRKASSAVEGASQAPVASRVSTPRSARRHGDNRDGFFHEQPNKVHQTIAQNPKKFDISSFPYLLPPGIEDTALGFFQPAEERDFTTLRLKPNHHNRPLYIDSSEKIFLKSFYPLAPQTQDFLITITKLLL